jgi:nucleoside-diphosphate-sugar epimerase
MKCLITGGAGFIGAHLAKRLIDDGHEVHLVDNFSRGKNDQFIETLISDGAKLFDVDLLEPSELDSLDSDYELIYHFAAIIGVQNVLNRPYNTLVDNVQLLANIIEFSRKNETLQRLVFTSTSEVYCGSLLHLDMPIPTPENTPLALPDLKEARTSYMLSKIYGEAMLQSSGLPFTIVRPHNIYGPRMGMSHVIPELLFKMYNSEDGASVDIASPTHTRTFCYIADAIDIIVESTLSEKCKNETINLGKQTPEITIAELAEVILEVVGKKLTISHGQVTAGSPSRRCPDMTKTKDLLDYESATDLLDGVEKTFSWYKENTFKEMK